jgi:hypothetical protein
MRPELVARVRKLVPLLGSDVPGEAAAIAAAIGRRASTTSTASRRP